MRLVIGVFVCAVMFGGSVEAATRTVCSSGCQYSSLQAAIDAAVPGDTILLRAGQTFTGHFILRNKNTTSTQFITIQSDAAATSLPAAGVRLIPEGKPGWNTRRSALARLVGVGGTGKSVPIIRTAPGAHHYRLQFLEIDGLANVGYETLVALGSDAQRTLAEIPHTIVFDRVWFHGHPTKGMKRGIYLNSRATDILNSYFNDFFHFSDAQALGGAHGPGPYRIVNNHLEAAGENILFGGADPSITNMIPSDIEIRGNYLTKDLRWRDPILATPARPTAAASSTSGTLAGGTHYFKVAAMIASGGGWGYSAGSAEVAVSVTAGRSVTLSWPAVAKAERYRIYRGTTSNGQNVYLDTPGTQTSFTYTGVGERSGTPRTVGTKWTAKNLLELKNGRRVTIDGNLFEYNWAGFQFGYAILFSPRNQSGGAPWTVVSDITFTNNIVRHAAGGIHILGRDYTYPSQQTRNLTIRNNLFEDLDNAFGAKGGFVSISEGPAYLTFDHNTIDHEGGIVEIMAGDVIGFVYTNNLSRHNTYGIKGQATATGNATLAAFFPGAVFRGNVLAGGLASSYPSGNYFPPASEFLSQFVSPSTGDWRLASTSTYNNRATDGRDIGADFGALQGAQNAAAGGGGGTIDPDDPEEEDPPTPGPLPSGWLSRDVGSVGQPGSASGSSGSLTVSGAGADVWGTADAFHFAYTPMTGDTTVTAQVNSITGADAWTKVGVMIRASTASNAAHAFMLVSTGKGLAFQRRASTGAASAHTSGGSGTAPRWVRLTRRGNVVTAFASSNGTSWTTVGSATITLPATALVGVAVSSHDVTRLATGAFQNVRIEAAPAAQPAGGWQAGDIGTVGQAGSTSGSGSSLTVSGSGADVWDRADAFHFAHTPMTGDGTITAQVASIVGAEPWTKVGVMIRASTDANAAHAFMLVSTGKGLAFQRRPASGALSAHTSGGSGTAPRWVRLTRRGSVVTAYVSSNGTSWTTVGSATITLPATALAGVAVSSHDTTRLATGSFENVVVVDSGS